MCWHHLVLTGDCRWKGLQPLLPLAEPCGLCSSSRDLGRIQQPFLVLLCARKPTKHKLLSQGLLPKSVRQVSSSFFDSSGWQDNLSLSWPFRWTDNLLSCKAETFTFITQPCKIWWWEVLALVITKSHILIVDKSGRIFTQFNHLTTNECLRTKMANGFQTITNTSMYFNWK